MVSDDAHYSPGSILRRFHDHYGNAGIGKPFLSLFLGLL